MMEQRQGWKEVSVFSGIDITAQVNKVIAKLREGYNVRIIDFLELQDSHIFAVTLKTSIENENLLDTKRIELVIPSNIEYIRIDPL